MTLPELSAATSRSVYLLQVDNQKLCKALRAIADGCDDPISVAKSALNSKDRTNQLVERDAVAGVVEACANIVGKAMTEADINGRDEVSDELYQVQCAIYNLDTAALAAIKGGEDD